VTSNEGDPDRDKKLQDENQVKGRYGELLAAFAFPPHWVVRPIPDDYGLDLELEVFHEVARRKNGVRRYQTRGEHLYLQVKTTDSLQTQQLERRESGDLAVVPFQMSITDLKLVDLMGASVPVVLLLVDRSKTKIYYVCLTDYVSHYLDVEDADWRSQKSARIYVPQRNQLTTSGDPDELAEHWNYFFRLARRSKLYSAFNLIHHYKEELRHALPRSGYDGPEPTPEYFKSAVDFLNRFARYVAEIKRLDVWPAQDEYGWATLHEAVEDLGTISQSCSDLLAELATGEAMDEERKTQLVERFIRKAEWEFTRLGRLDVLGRSYHTLGRKERLPGTDPFNASDLSDFR
jgi:hypothetical protein